MKDSIKVYSLPTCGMCKALKQLLKTRNIQYEDCQDIELMKELGITGTPTLEFNGVRYYAKKAVDFIKQHFILSKDGTYIYSEQAEN